MLVGRDRERALLDACVREAVAGRGGLVLLAGEAGIGKTALARTVLCAGELQVLEGTAQAGATPAFAPLAEALSLTGVPADGVGTSADGTATPAGSPGGPAGVPEPAEQFLAALER